METLLGVVILFFLSGTLIPMTFYMKHEIASQKMQTHAAEVAFNGALTYSRYGEQTGIQEIDGIVYEWFFDGAGVCVSYNDGKRNGELCL